MSSRSQGITLVELVVVMAILSVLLAFVAPTISGSLDNLRLESMGRTVASMLRAAHIAARNEGRQLVAIYDESSLRLLRDSQVFRTLPMPRGIRILVPGPATAAFLETGQIVGPDTIELANDAGRRIQLSIDHATGLVRLVHDR
jgi:prepilin-type N-terminal cleavage/methylation domain-containing protein